ncbi:MAG: NTP transferase domain-containing protein [Egibacteraceae bacterium]
MRGPVAGMLLAAGGGRRLGGPKALVQMDGEPLVERGVRLLVDGGCDPVVVVLGAAADAVLSQCHLHPARPVVNHRWARGMSTSLREGLDALEASAAGAVVVALADQPQVGPEAVRRLAAAWRDGGRLVVAAYAGSPRNPVLVDRAWWPSAWAAATGDQGVRALQHARPELVTLIECGDTGSAADLDTAEDLAALGGRLPDTSTDDADCRSDP